MCVYAYICICIHLELSVVYGRGAIAALNPKPYLELCVVHGGGAVAQPMKTLVEHGIGDEQLLQFAHLK
jgi:hypothetical protein